MIKEKQKKDSLFCTDCTNCSVNSIRFGCSQWQDLVSSTPITMKLDHLLMKTETMFISQIQIICGHWSSRLLTYMVTKSQWVTDMASRVMQLQISQKASRLSTSNFQFLLLCSQSIIVIICVVVLIGVVVNNGIVLVDDIDRRVRRKTPVKKRVLMQL